MDVVSVLAKRCGIAPRSIERVFGSQRILRAEQNRDTSSPEEGKALELGLNVLQVLRGRNGVSDHLAELLHNAYREYANTAPQVVRFLESGDFNPKKIPPRITRGVLMHGCRTAGRLRARVLRELEAEPTLPQNARALSTAPSRE